MRDRVYVPERIANDETNMAVTTLAYELNVRGVCGFGEAKERICRLLGWMCERAGEDGGRGEESV